MLQNQRYLDPYTEPYKHCWAVNLLEKVLLAGKTRVEQAA